MWRAPLNEIALAGVAATSSLVIVADRELDDTVDVWRTFDAATGAPKWTFRFPAEGRLDYGNSPRGTPLIDGDRVILVGAHGHVHAVSLATGKPLWQRNTRLEFPCEEELPWGVCASPLLVEGKLILNPGAPHASLVALDPATGKTLWTSPGGPPSYGSLIAGKIGGKLQIIGHDKTTLGGWDPATGKRLWKREGAEGDFNVPTPVIVGKQLLVVTENAGARLYEFAEDGKIVPESVAHFADLRPDTQSPVVVGNRVFCARDQFYCLDLQKSLQATYASDEEAFAEHVSLVGTDDRLLIATAAAELILIDPRADRFQPLSRLRVLPNEAGLLSHPALVGTKLFLRGSREIVCVDLSAD